MNGLKQLRVILQTEDMARGVVFYRDTLGLTVTWPEVEDYSDQFWVTFEAAGASLALHAGREEPIGKSSPEVGFLVEDLEGVLARVRSGGGEFGDPVEPHPGVKFSVGRDPDGNKLILSQA